VTDAEIIDGILNREKRGEPPWIAPGDRGGRTSWGISERAHPEAWVDGPPSRERAAEIYRLEYLEPFASLEEPLRIQMIDIGVTSGVSEAWKLLQKVIGVRPDGSPGPVTRAALAAAGSARMINNALVAARLQFIDQITDGDLRQKINEEGWENRALVFLVL
jgi:lysozyme family protein